MPKVLVTGAGGFVGRSLVSALQKVGRDVRASTRKDGDLSDPKFCKKILTGVETVFYLAGSKKNLRFHLAQPYTFAAENLRPFLTFLNALERSRVKKLIYLSSTIVEYANDDKEIDGYVLGKYLNERLIEAFRKQFQIDVKLVRSVATYGPGDNFDPRSANFLPAMIRKVFAAREEVEVWGRGKRKLQFIYIDDLVKNLLATEKAKGNFFVFGHPQSIGVNEIVRKIIVLSGKRLQIKNNWQEADKPTKLARFKNFIAPRVSLSEGLRRTISYYQGQLRD
jgi:nucleoside-diphosphate-sugar epimerase